MIIFDTTEAVAPAAYSLQVPDGTSATLEHTGTGTVKLMKKARDSYEQLYIEDTAQELTATNNSVRIIGPANVFFEKAITGVAVEVRSYSTLDM